MGYKLRNEIKLTNGNESDYFSPQLKLFGVHLVP